jgi:hypothetical protein
MQPRILAVTLTAWIVPLSLPGRQADSATPVERLFQRSVGYRETSDALLRRSGRHREARAPCRNKNSGPVPSPAQFNHGITVVPLAGQRIGLTHAGGCTLPAAPFPIARQTGAGDSFGQAAPVNEDSREPTGSSEPGIFRQGEVRFRRNVYRDMCSSPTRQTQK